MIKQLAVRTLNTFPGKIAAKVARPFILDRYLSLPEIICVETTSVCNSRCVMCSNKNLTRKRGFMSFDLWKTIIDQIEGKKFKTFSPVFQGEMFLHPGWEELLEYAKGKFQARTFLNTNGQLLTEENAKKVLPLITDIRFDIDGTTKEVYESIRCGLDFDTVIRNYKRFIDINAAAGHPVKVHATFLKMPQNQHQAQQFLDEWSALVDEIDVAGVMNYAGSVDGDDAKVYQPCIQLWNTMMITWEGKIALCCLDADCQQELGDLNNETIIKAWNNDAYWGIRKQHYYRIAEGLCSRCNFESEYPLWRAMFD